jgi:class 3 adenylate cyclase
MTHVRSFDQPDEVIEVEGVTSQIVTLGGIAVARLVHQPGWRWSDRVKPLVGTEWCETHHMGINLAGRFHVRLATGEEYEMGAGEVFDIPPGHDGWVIGDEPYVAVEWTGALSWIASLETLTQRVLATVLFTDIVASTEVARRVGAVAWGEMLAVHDDRVRDTVARFRGRVVKTTGDGVLALFDSPARAIQAALALCEMARGMQLAIRASVHTGEVELTSDDVRGVVVHEAARILSLAEPDQVMVSATTRELAGAGEWTFQDRGEHLLKGTETTRRLYSVSR